MKRKFKFAPLNGAFMASSILGILISAMYVLPVNETWGLTFLIAFGVMFIASVISMTVADPDEFIELENQ